jgi:hypothetical protein
MNREGSSKVMVFAARRQAGGRPFVRLPGPFCGDFCGLACTDSPTSLYRVARRRRHECSRGQLGVQLIDRPGVAKREPGRVGTDWPELPDVTRAADGGARLIP